MRADQELIDDIKKGKTELFSELVHRHQKVLLRVAIRMTRELEMAEDIVQESFLKAYRKLESFEGRSSFRSWLYQITINTAKNKLRKRRHDSVDIDKVNLAVGAEAEFQVAHNDLKGILKDEVDKLPPKQRMALHLRIFEELSFKEIAEIMKCPYDTAKANYRHALMKLRHRFSESMALEGFKDFEKTMAVDYRGRVAEVES